MSAKWLPNISLFNFNKTNNKHNFVRSRKRFRTITWKYAKTIGPFASFIYLFNQSIGSGLFDIPSLIDEVGWIPVIFGNVFVCSVAAFCSLMILRAMTIIPKNKNFEQRIEYSAVIKYFMSNEKYKFVSFLYHLGNICNNICGILVISKIIDIFIIKIFGYTILFEIYPQIQIKKCSLSFLDAMFNGYYYSNTGNYETIFICGFTIGYIINAIICIHLSSKGLEETINYQYVVFMIFMSSFLYLSISSTIYLFSHNYNDSPTAIKSINMHNNLILSRAHIEPDLIKNYQTYNELNHFKKTLLLCKNTPSSECLLSNNIEKNSFSDYLNGLHEWNNNIDKNVSAKSNNDSKILNNFNEKNNILHSKNAPFFCSFMRLNNLYKKKAYIFRNSIFFLTVLSCSKDLKIHKSANIVYFYYVYKIYNEFYINNSNATHSEKMKQFNADSENFIEDEYYNNYKNDLTNKYSNFSKNGNNTNNNKNKEKEIQKKTFFEKLYLMISKIEGIKTYCMGKTFANFIDSYGFVSNIPSWGNEITDDVNVSKSIWFTVIFSSIFYFIFGIIFCLNNSFKNINTSVLYIFNLVAVAPKVITGSISMRYDLMNLDICSDGVAFFFACIAPFLLAWLFSNGILFSNTFNYISLICGLFCNFLSPAFTYIAACESNVSFYKNPLRKYTIVNRKKTVLSSSSDIRKALGNIIDKFGDDNHHNLHIDKNDNENETLKKRVSKFNRSMSLSQSGMYDNSITSSNNSGSFFIFENGEYIPKSYSKDDTDVTNLSNKSSIEITPLLDNFDLMEKNEIDKKGDSFDNITNKEINQVKKKKKGIRFSIEVENDDEDNNLKNTNIYNSYEKKEKSNDKNKYQKESLPSKKKAVCFSESFNTDDGEDNPNSNENQYSPIIELNTKENYPKKKTNIKKKIMFSEEVEVCKDEGKYEGSKKNVKKKKGVAFSDQAEMNCDNKKQNLKFNDDIEALASEKYTQEDNTNLYKNENKLKSILSNEINDSCITKLKPGKEPQLMNSNDGKEKEYITCAKNSDKASIDNKYSHEKMPTYEIVLNNREITQEDIKKCENTNKVIMENICENKKNNEFALSSSKGNDNKKLGVNLNTPPCLEYERILSDSAINYNVNDEINETEKNRNESIIKNRSFENPDHQLFKRKREKLKSQFKSNMPRNFCNYNKLIQGINSLKSEEENEDINNTIVNYSTQNETTFDDDNVNCDLSTPCYDIEKHKSISKEICPQETILKNIDTGIDKKETVHYHEKNENIKFQDSEKLLNKEKTNKNSSCYKISLSFENNITHEKENQMLLPQHSINEHDNSKSNTLFVRQRKKLKSSFHANGNMIIGDSKEAIHVEQINNFRNKFNIESDLNDNNNNIQISENEINDEKAIENTDFEIVPILKIMKSYENHILTENDDSPIKNVKKNKPIKNVRHQTHYKFADLSDLYDDIHKYELENVETNYVNTKPDNDEESKQLLEISKNNNLNKERNETAETSSSIENEKSSIIKQIEQIYTELADKMHSGISEMSTNDDIDYVDIRQFKIIDNNSPVKHYYNVFHKSKNYNSNKYEYIYSNNIILNNKTNMDHLCSIFLFGNPLERNEEYEESRKKISKNNETTNITSSQNKISDIKESSSISTRFKNTKNSLSSSGLHEKQISINSPSSRNIENYIEIVNKNYNVKSTSGTVKPSALKKTSVNFSVNDEVINNEELNNIIKSNDINIKKNSSNKIEVMKIRIHVYPDILQKYHVETTYVLLGFLTAFSFVGIITDLLFG
ncbi:amino acid transporter, putative [Plasmodium chabaudi adami]|uniref:Amino acid transporter, putative n=1 Tax=Plasmodium chabaudi adami TaxID=5826 RepID=A0A1C6YQ13_PLACE|nr:amino acid transporter, putative [Plasmodium chabaudi adami]